MSDDDGVTTDHLSDDEVTTGHLSDDDTTDGVSLSDNDVTSEGDFSGMSANSYSGTSL